MKKSISEYAIALTSSNTELLEELIGKKYKKFIRFYRLLSDYSDYIKKFDYEISGRKDELTATITFEKSVCLDEKKEFIAEMRRSGYEVNSKKQGKKMRLQIFYVE